MFSPITKNMEERLKLVKESMSKELASEELQKCESLEDFYWYAQRVTNGIVGQMEVYIIENYEKVPLEVWNSHHFDIYPHTGEERLYFGKEDEYKPHRLKVLDKMFKKRYDKSTKIDSIKFILDAHDGDFSVTFNDGPWSFLWDSDVLDYYMVIKNYLDDK